MKFNRRLLEKVLIVLAILAPIFFAVRLFIHFTEISVSTGFFKVETSACILYNAVALLVFFVCLCFSFSKKGKSLNKKTRHGKKNSLEEDLLLQSKNLTSPDEDKIVLSGFEKAVGNWHGTLSAFAMLFVSFAFLSYGVMILLEKESYSDYYALLLSALSFLSGAFFLTATFQKNIKRGAFMGFFALSPVLYCALRLLNEYRDLTRFLNKELYVGQFLFVIASLIFFVYQAQMLLGDQNLLRPNLYAFNTLPVLFLGLSARLPQLIAILGEKMTMDLTTSTGILVDLAITLFVGVKLSAILRNS